MVRRQGAAAVAGETNGMAQATEEPGQAAITAAGRPVDLDASERRGYRRKAKRETWQEEAWSFFDIIGEIKQPTYFLANTCSLIRVFIGAQPDPEQDPQIAPAGMAGVFEANDVLERMRTGARGGIGSLVKETVLNHKIAGECWLAGIPEQQARPANPALNQDELDYEPETWDVRSVSEVFTKGTGKAMRYWYREDPGDRDGKAFPTDESTGREKALLTRVWQEHPEFSELPDCAMRALLTECEELLILTRAVKAAGRSRIAGNGLLLIPNELEIVNPPPAQNQPEGEAGKDRRSFTQKLVDAMTMPIQNEGDPSAVVPLVVRGPGEHLDKVRHITFDRTVDGVMIEQRRELIQRLAQGSDVPIEVVVGLKNINHWTAYQVDQSTWTRYGHPAVRTALDAWTTGVLRPMLVDGYGLNPDVANRLMFWYDPADAVMQPDRSADVIAAFDRMGLSWDALRTYLQFSEVDAPDDDEIARRVELAVAMKGSSGSGASGDPGADGGAPNGGTPPSSPSETARQLEDLLPGVSEYLKVNGGRLPLMREFRPKGLRASARPARRQRGEPLGRRLLSIDRRLRDGLQHAADAAMMRALDQAGARLRNKARKIPDLKARIDKLAAHDVPRILGPTMARTLGFETDDDLLAGTFDGMEPLFAQKVATAQGQTLDLLAADYGLDEDEIRSLQLRQERDRNDAWIFLVGALVALGHDRLYNPSPTAPERGEFDASASVPPGILRDAMTRAGGAAAGGAPDQPAGGVALGQLVQDVWARHGQVVDGWEWVYGDPSSRTTPFDPHLDLDGVQFANWTDDVLLNSEGWPETDYFRPGDHPWCQCDFSAVGPGALGGDEDQADEDIAEEVTTDA